MKKVNVIICIVLLILMIIGTILETNSIVVTHMEYSNSKISSEFNGYKIVQISDLHNKRFGKNQSKLIDKIKECNPDIIIVTGDLVDKRYYNLDVAMEFINNAINIAPIYYVSGNHEISTEEYEDIKRKLIDSNVVVLDNESILLNKNEESIKLAGLLDPSYYDGTNEVRKTKLNEELKKLVTNEEFEILLSHRPEILDIYSENNIDLVFTGHAHGGQIRIPFIGAIIAPHQGLFPKYTEGQYTLNNTTMIVSRGLGTSVITVRIFNKPEIILLELKSVNQ